MKTSINKLFIVVWISICPFLNCIFEQQILRPINPEVIQGSNITLVCTIPGDAEYRYIDWVVYTEYPAIYYDTTTVYVIDGTCELKGGKKILIDLSKPTNFFFGCNSTGTWVTITSVQGSLHNMTWKCAPDPALGWRFGWKSAKNSTISVKVPVSTVSINPKQDIINIKENETEAFTCKTSETRPYASVTWYKVESGVTSQVNETKYHTSSLIDKHKDFGVTESKITFALSRQQNGIKIFCEANNTVNTSPIRSSEKILNVLYPPTVVHMNNVTLIEDSTLDINCTYTLGNPIDMTVQWTRDIDSRTWNGAQLLISKVTLEDTGTYQCRVLNSMQLMDGVLEYGSDMKTFYLQVNVPSAPDSPSAVRYVVDHTTTSSIHLEWKPGYNGGTPQTFHIKYKTSSSNTWSYVNIDDTGEDIMQYTLTGLSEKTHFDIVVYASNKMGTSTESSIVIAMTKGNESSNTSSIIGVVVGGILGATIIVVVLVLIIHRYNPFKECKTKDKNAEIRDTPDNTNTTNEDRTYYNENIVVGTAEYEILNHVTPDSATYSALQTTENNQTSGSQSSEKPYENLEMQVVN